MTNLRTHCNKCGGVRNHEIVHVERTSWEEVTADDCCIDGWDIYEMVKCRGCDNVMVRHRSCFSQCYDENGNPDVETYYYPPIRLRKEAKWIYQLRFKQDDIYGLFKEVYIALRNNCPRVAAMGIRALLEHMMIDKIGDQGSFKKNLNDFEHNGFISKIQRDVLEPVLEVGHATMHRSYVPTIADLNSIIDIAENIAEAIYINESRARDLLSNVPLKG